MTKPVIIGLSGGSGSGKSTILRRLLGELGPEQVSVLEHDAYYLDLTHLSLAERAAVNFDHPDSLETSLLVEHVDALLAGRSIQKPVYDFTKHTRAAETLEIQPTPIIIVEGILALAEPDLVRRMAIKLFVDTDDDTRLIRRIRRDMVERGRSLNSVLEQYETTVRPMHIEFVEPSKRHADVIIPRGGHNEVAFEMVLARIRTMLYAHLMADLIN
ncbi:MAG: uridine kinase [Bacteroidetes Order II. Incertae sedis bacterium]|jgi:uridine kinase|nr:uridine kinase [Bacteroidetes Order II. bacterium]MBT4052441.1 uridine kinase [Bacteroidetes Order II. bacterium]MBT4603782.1 uridine kinase [Bacteroidetes Order II. bacterium]MBT5250472.1 uridine kinase [Bacteroidetes Order II. bacterium]MBT6199814.1 uridine kinase [Bacteroidetes Order II. bacterium]